MITAIDLDTNSLLILSNFVGSISSQLLATATAKLYKDEVDPVLVERVDGREHQ